MVNVPYDEKLTNNTWSLWQLSSGRYSVVTRCPNGHIGTLDHDIAADGTVTPSVVCQRDGCNYHEFIKLDGWSHGPKQRGEYIDPKNGAA
jgi:hypothetical protein